ncbi:Golgi-associated RAB2 interactor protein 6-like [Heteronotia binoei]|uniref:Golgi-associated RAB2 interactor protein 6-like n=1 Tax=Heteronotia binoei TaxID=13085 RepID=UPI00292D6B92|nr:Golgi-associated RAB2 interactor protein 6-like [Heteronotia binoei]
MGQSKTHSSVDNSKMSFRDMGARKDFCNTRIGPLQRQLWKGEYGLFKYSPMLESDFVQISKQGGPIEVTTEEQIMTVGISFTSPVLRIPDVLLVARPIYLSEDPTLPHDTKFHPGRKVKYELSRLFPLRLVKISIHNAEKQQLRFKLVSGRTFYLQLCPELDRGDRLFDSWIRIIQLLWPPPETNLEKNKAIKSNPIRSTPVPILKTPSPKCSAKTASPKCPAGSKQTITKSLMGKKNKKKTKKAKSPVKVEKAQDPAPPARREQEAEPVSRPPPPQIKEVTEEPKEELVERKPLHHSQAGEERRREKSPPASRYQKSTGWGG